MWGEQANGKGEKGTGQMRPMESFLRMEERCWGREGEMNMSHEVLNGLFSEAIQRSESSCALSTTAVWPDAGPKEKLVK